MANKKVNLAIENFAQNPTAKNAAKFLAWLGPDRYVTFLQIESKDLISKYDNRKHDVVKAKKKEWKARK